VAQDEMPETGEFVIIGYREAAPGEIEAVRIR
jgi:hypothetical protein